MKMLKLLENKLEITKENIILINLIQTFIIFVVITDFFLVNQDKSKIFGHIIIPLNLCIIILLTSSSFLLITNLIFVYQFGKTSENKIEKTNFTLRKQRHEFFNQLESIRYYITNNKIDEAIDYMEYLGITINTQVHLDKIKNSCFAGVVNNFTDKCESKGVLFEFNTRTNLENFKILPLYITTIFNNMLINALENCKTRDYITLEVIEDNYKFKFIFSNTGLAIDENLEIFLAGVSTKGKNRGLGLSIVKETLGKCNGEIYIEEYDSPIFVIEINKKEE